MSSLVVSFFYPAGALIAALWRIVSSLSSPHSLYNFCDRQLGCVSNCRIHLRFHTWSTPLKSGCCPEALFSSNIYIQTALRVNNLDFWKDKVTRSSSAQLIGEIMPDFIGYDKQSVIVNVFVTSYIYSYIVHKFIVNFYSANRFNLADNELIIKTSC